MANSVPTEPRSNRVVQRPAPAQRRGLIRNFEDILGELRKVIWPTRKELVTYTVVCLVFVLFMVVVVTSLDYGFTKLVFVVFG